MINQMSFRTKKLTSSVCKQSQLESKRFQKIYHKLKVREWFDDFSAANNIVIPAGILHRKSWEYAYITLALQERGMLKKGRRGLGFAVGTEPLPAYFASKGCSILATDIGSYNETANSWMETGQNAMGNMAVLNKHNLCDQRIFKNNVQFRNVDMNDIPSDLGGFDFCWSSCAIEHIGSLEKSKLFLKNMINTLKPGGVAVHTTEYNLSSNEATLEEGINVIYRKCDLEEISEWMKQLGHELDFDFSLGNQEGDLFTDQPPYYQINPKYHLRLNIDGYDSTSIGIIITKKK